MARVRPIKTNFTNGEVDPLITMRSDLELFVNGAAKMRNVVAFPQGGFRRRDGQEFMTAIPPGNDRLCFGFHGGQRGSIGLAVGIDFRATVDWIADKTSWLSNGLFPAGSVVIDPLGIVSVIVDET